MELEYQSLLLKSLISSSRLHNTITNPNLKDYKVQDCTNQDYITCLDIISLGPITAMPTILNPTIGRKKIKLKSFGIVCLEHVHDNHILYNVGYDDIAHNFNGCLVMVWSVAAKFR